MNISSVVVTRKVIEPGSVPYLTEKVMLLLRKQGIDERCALCCDC
jgi:hypothetical protein